MHATTRIELNIKIKKNVNLLLFCGIKPHHFTYFFTNISITKRNNTVPSVPSLNIFAPNIEKAKVIAESIVNINP